MTLRKFGHRGWKKKKVDWSKPYKPSAFDLARDPALAEERAPFEWKSLRDFKAKENKQNPHRQEDALYRKFGSK